MEKIPQIKTGESYTKKKQLVENIKKEGEEFSESLQEAIGIQKTLSADQKMLKEKSRELSAGKIKETEERINTNKKEFDRLKEKLGITDLES